MYKLIEYSDNYSKISGSLWQYYRDEPDDNDLTGSESFKFKVKITGNTSIDGNTKNVNIMVPLKYLSNFWRNLEIFFTYSLFILDVNNNKCTIC